MAFNWFKKLKNGLSKSATKVEKAFKSVIGKKSLDEQTLADLEDQLIMADLGIDSANQIVEKLRSHKFNLNKGEKCLVILPDSIRNYLTKFVNDTWMTKNNFKVK